MRMYQSVKTSRVHKKTKNSNRSKPKVKRKVAYRKKKYV